MQKKFILIKCASYASVITAVIITIIKIYAWTKTGSLSILSSTIDSFFDILASFVNLFAVSYALKPADEDHRFGHGKAEDIAALAQSTFIAGSAFFIVIEAIGRVLNPSHIDVPFFGINIMVISSILCLALLAFQNYVIKQTNSTIIRSDSLHYRSDFIMNLAVIAVLFLSMKFDVVIIDLIIASLIAIYIFMSAFTVGKQSFDNLMDKEFIDSDRQKIINTVLEHKQVSGVHDLRTRRSSTKPFIQLHLELDGNMSLEQAHEITKTIEDRLLELFPLAEVFIHQDPSSAKELPLHLGQAVSLNHVKK